MVCLWCVSGVECDYESECHCVSVSVSQVCLWCAYVHGCIQGVSMLFNVTTRLSVSIRGFVGALVSLSLSLSRSPSLPASLPPSLPSTLPPSLPPPLSPQHAHLHPVLLRGVFIWALLSRDQKLQRSFFFNFFNFFCGVFIWPSMSRDQKLQRSFFLILFSGVFIWPTYTATHITTHITCI
jgi:hypothetical protein